MHTISKSLGLVALAAAFSFGQTDPGPRPGPSGAGAVYADLGPEEKAAFLDGLEAFNEVDSVSGTIPGAPAVGLGPTFNGNSCAMCHSQPAIGGSSPGLRSPQNPVPNPQVALATLHGARNRVPSFIRTDGPVREARFIAVSGKSSSALDGGVKGLFTIRGRTDAPGCNLEQPDFESHLQNDNVIFRIPTPLFGLGFVEGTSDATLQANLDANSQTKASLGIHGRLNLTDNDGTVTKFGWKAQNKSLLIFSGEAYNVEQGVSNFAFTNERSAVAGCVFNGGPEDTEDVIEFANFMRFLAPPTPTTSTSSEKHGQDLFTSIGCAHCHTPALTTTKSTFPGMSNFTYRPYSDFALHHMGSNLADGIVQGSAGPDEFRTAPLWGVGQRLFFLHDGRTSDLLRAITEHASSGNDCVSAESSREFEANHEFFQPSSRTRTCGSEANSVISKFNSLSRSDKQDILNFLRSL